MQGPEESDKGCRRGLHCSRYIREPNLVMNAKLPGTRKPRNRQSCSRILDMLPQLNAKPNTHLSEPVKSRVAVPRSILQTTQASGPPAFTVRSLQAAGFVWLMAPNPN